MNRQRQRTLSDSDSRPAVFVLRLTSRKTDGGITNIIGNQPRKQQASQGVSRGNCDGDFHKFTFWCQFFNQIFKQGFDQQISLEFRALSEDEIHGIVPEQGDGVRRQIVADDGDFAGGIQ